MPRTVLWVCAWVWIKYTPQKKNPIDSANTNRIFLNQKHTQTAQLFFFVIPKQNECSFGQVWHNWPTKEHTVCTECSLESCCADLVFALSFSCRYAHPGHPAAGHTTHAGQCAAALLLCVLHFRHRRSSALGRPPPEPLFCGRHLPFVSACFILLV